MLALTDEQTRAVIKVARNLGAGVAVHAVDEGLVEELEG
jgi:hypothetical protein